MDLVEEFLKENPPESVINMFMNTSFNKQFMTREEAIKKVTNLNSKLREQTYGKNSRLYFHASDRPHDPIKESKQESGESLCFFSNKPEAALAVVKVRHNWNHDFCFLHVCKLKSSVNLFNPQCKTDIKKVSFTNKELKIIQDETDWIKRWTKCAKLPSPERWWRIYEAFSIPSAIKKAGFSGIALNFWDMNYETPEVDRTEGIALFKGNQMHVLGIKVVNLKDEFKDYDWYLKDIKKKREIEKEYEVLLNL